MGTMIEEQETQISWSRGDEFAEIYTTDTLTMTKLDRLCKKHPDVWSLASTSTVRGEIFSKTYKCPRKMVSFRSKATVHSYKGNTTGLERYREQKRIEREKGE